MPSGFRGSPRCVLPPWQYWHCYTRRFGIPEGFRISRTVCVGLGTGRPRVSVSRACQHLALSQRRSWLHYAYITCEEAKNCTAKCRMSDIRSVIRRYNHPAEAKRSCRRRRRMFLTRKIFRNVKENAANKSRNYSTAVVTWKLTTSSLYFPFTETTVSGYERT